MKLKSTLLGGTVHETTPQWICNGCDSVFVRWSKYCPHCQKEINESIPLKPIKRQTVQQALAKLERKNK
jgi:predicted amidophosphoribosyltransferase